jgi:hypothetical protein
VRARGGRQACRHRRGGLPGYGGWVSIGQAGGGEQCPACGDSDLRPYCNGSKWACPRCHFLLPCCEGGELAGLPQPTGAAAHRPTVPGGRLRGRPHAEGNAARIPRRPVFGPRRQASDTNDQRSQPMPPSPGDQSHPFIADAPHSVGPVCDSHRCPVRPDAARCQVPAPGRQPGSIEPAGKLGILVKPAQVIVAACG